MACSGTCAAAARVDGGVLALVLLLVRGRLRRLSGCGIGAGWCAVACSSDGADAAGADATVLPPLPLRGSAVHVGGRLAARVAPLWK